MRALLLAAGLGTRLRPITDTVPKCLVPIHGVPLLDYWLDTLFVTDAIEHVVINLHYLASAVEKHVAASPWRDRVTLVFEPELLGTGGTLIANRQALKNGPVLVAHADNLTDFDVTAFQRFHSARPPGIVMSMLAFRTDLPKTCGILELDERGLVKAFHEKVDDPPGNLANAAVYIVESEVVDFAAAIGRPFVDLSLDVIPHLIGRIVALETTGYHRDIGTLESLALAHAEFSPAGAFAR
jgi:mannose-1-phosphate guanylyltransferase